MLWTALPVDRMLSVEYLRVSAATRGHHAALILLCAQRETAGRVVGAKSWTNRDWLMAAGCDRRAIAAVVAAGFSSWDGHDLIVLDYDAQRESRVKAQRIVNTNNAESRWSGDGNRNATRTATRNAEESRVEESRSDQTGSGYGGAPPMPRVGAATEQFLRVWNAYPHKTDKAEAATNFQIARESEGLSEADMADRIIAALKWQVPRLKEFWEKSDGKTKLKKYIAARRWDDPAPEPRAERSPYANDNRCEFHQGGGNGVSPTTPGGSCSPCIDAWTSGAERPV